MKFVIDALPNEHIFSWLLRMYLRSGFADFFSYQKSLGFKERYLHAYKVFSPATECLVSLFDDRDIGIKFHTTAPVWQISVGKLLGKHPPPLHSFNHMTEEMLFGFDTSWHSCKACRAQDLERYGTTYWHAPHQISSIYTCYKHNGVLEKATNPVINLFAEVFPHDVAGWTPIQTNITQTLSDWQAFYININEIMTTEPVPALNLKDELLKVFEFKDKIIAERLAIGAELNQQFIHALGPSLVTYLFRRYLEPHNGLDRNLINMLLSRRESAKGVRHPIHLIALAYWQRVALNL